LTRLTYPKKEENQQAHFDFQDTSHHEAGQVLHLKRLLITVKQHYEKSLQQLQIQLQAEQNQRLATQKERDRAQFRLTEKQGLYEEELQALRHQQNTLKEILKKAQDELSQFRRHSQGDDPTIEKGGEGAVNEEKEVFSLREQVERAVLESEQLRNELHEAHKKAKALEQELLKGQQSGQKGADQLQQLLDDQKSHDDDLETVVSTTSSHYLRRELDMIKRMLIEDTKETKALEARYIEVLNEKIELDHQSKQLQQQLENQSSNLTAFREQLHNLEERKKGLEFSLQAKEAEWVESCQQRQELQIRLDNLSVAGKEKELIQDQYELLKEESKQINERLEEAVEARMQLEEHLDHLEAIAANQETQLQESAEQMQMLHQEKISIESERNQLRIILDECEGRLKVAQQHLAKKVKEAAILSEKAEEQQLSLNECVYAIEDQKTQVAHLQASVDFYQKQEKKIQEQLHEALKGNESQIVKWEEKYFRMYDKWQESERHVRELKKFEEKHLQMQSLLVNLGNFMGGPANLPQPTASSENEKGSSPFNFEGSQPDEPPFERHQGESHEEKFNVFGMRHPL